MIVAKKLSNSNGRRMKTTPWRFFKKKYFLTQESGMKKAHSSSKFLPRGELFGSQKKNILKEFHVQNLGHQPERNKKVWLHLSPETWEFLVSFMTSGFWVKVLRVGHLQFKRNPPYPASLNKKKSSATTPSSRMWSFCFSLFCSKMSPVSFG